MDSVADLVEPVKLEVRTSSDSYAKGKAIADANGVMIEVFNPLTVTAKVTSPGGEIQQTHLASRPGGLYWECTCNKEHDFCAHLVATALVAWERSPAHHHNRKADGQLPTAT
jgi:uncharacterized Zn finger protein